MAAPVFEKKFVQDIRQPVRVRRCGDLMFTGDAKADTIYVEVYNDGVPYNLTGTVTLNCIRVDGATVAVTGSISGNVAQATLAQACCAISGPLAVVMKITSGDVTSTILKAVYTVDVGVTGTTVDPGTIVNNVNTLIAAIETAVESIPADYSDLLAAIAPNYTDLTFPVMAGQHCWYDGDYYRAKVDIATSEVWTSAHWESAVLSEDVDEGFAELKSAIEELAENGYYEEGHAEDHYLELEAYGIKIDGTTDTSDKKAHIWLTSAQEALTLNFDASVYKYNLCYKNSGSVVQYTSWVTTSPIEIDGTITHDQVGVTFTTLDSASISGDDLGNILFYQTGGTIVGNLATKDFAVAKQQSAEDAGKTLVIGQDGTVVPGTPQVQISVDDTLSISGDAADAKKTGDTIKELAINGKISTGGETVYIPTAIGMIKNATPVTVDSTKTNTAYVKLSSSQETKQLLFDSTKYRINFAYFNNGTKTGFTSWVTTSPAIADGSIQHDEVYVNVNKLSGEMDNAEILTCLSYSETSSIGDLATKAYVDSFNPKGMKCIYPDGFVSRIMPDIYYNGRYYADINIDSYKKTGASAWVATTGDDTTGDGSESNPFATITKALTVSVTIHLKEGTYEQGTHYGTSVDFSGKNVIGHGTVVLQNDSSGHYVKVTTSAYFENIIFKHGSEESNSPFVSNTTSSGNVLCFVGCTFTDGAANGLSIKGTDAVLVNCIAYGNKLDGFNYHDNTSGNNTYIPNVLEIDCVAYNNGSSESGSDSCNGSTAHDGTKITRLNGEYYSCYGGVIAEIARTGEEPTISVNYGVLAHDSTGTGTYKASFWASTNTQMYLYDCSSYGGTYDISAVNDAKIVSWRLTTGRDEPSVNEASTATVIQH